MTSRVTIVGLGLIGGSLGMALRRKRLARVTGLSRKAATLRQAKRLGAIDTGTTDAREAVRDADIVVLATPVETIAPMAKQLARWMKPGAVITDVGSTKSAIVSKIGKLPRNIRFVGGHPVAGSEQRGLEAADPKLFAGSLCILTPVPGTTREALARVRAMWKPLVGRVMLMSPRRHDLRLALTSHLTHAVAFSLTRASAARAPIVPRSFLEATRVAKSNPALWNDIFLSNRREILHAMDAFAQEWRRLKQLLTQSDRAGLLKFLAEAKRSRDALD